MHLLSFFFVIFIVFIYKDDHWQLGFIQPLQFQDRVIMNVGSLSRCHNSIKQNRC